FSTSVSGTPAGSLTPDRPGRPLSSGDVAEPAGLPASPLEGEARSAAGFFLRWAGLDRQALGPQNRIKTLGIRSSRTIAFPNFRFFFKMRHGEIQDALCLLGRHCYHTIGV